MSFTPADTEVPIGADEYSANEDEDSEQDSRQIEKVACERCRRRKIKCDRVNPCAPCTRAQSTCVFPERRKPVARRQRVLISSIYESRMEHISRKIDDLAELMERHLDTRSEPAPKPKIDTRPLAVTQKKPDSSAISKAPSGSFSEQEGIDTSLFARAIVATKFLTQDPALQDVVHDMRWALETLQAVVDSNRRRNDMDDGSPPFDRPLPPGTSTRDLPLPPIDKVMACLRMSQEHPRIEMFWAREFRCLSQFTDYVIKVCSPGPATDAQLIIVYTGLFLLFSECSIVVDSQQEQQDFNEQAQVCRTSLETVLSNLGFYMPANYDYIFAMYMATLYCFHRGKLSTAWSFIKQASFLAQGLGLHNHSTMANDSVEEKNRKSFLFWIVYCLEKSISLRQGKSSTGVRDHDITIPKPVEMSKETYGPHTDLPDLVEASRLYGRVYDEIFSPSSISQPPHLRASRAQELAVEWERVMAARERKNKRLKQSPGYLMHPTLLKFIHHAAKVGDFAILTALHRVMPGRSTPGASISIECTSTARAALREHTECISLLRNEEVRSVHLDIWVNGSMLLSPFVPFNIIFCHIVETTDQADLENLKAFVDCLDLLSKTSRYSYCVKQLRIFRALYNVAAKYVEIKVKPPFGSLAACPSAVRMHASDVSITTDQPGGGNAVPAQDGPGMLGGHFELPNVTGPAVLESQNWADFSGMELDPLGTQLGNWFQDGSEMMNFLDS